VDDLGNARHESADANVRRSTIVGTFTNKASQVRLAGIKAESARSPWRGH
jgi:hypothetical protein